MNEVLANELIREAIHSAKDLITTVDEWLGVHPLPL
jgi:porphobilinogen deaminase